MKAMRWIAAALALGLLLAVPAAAGVKGQTVAVPSYTSVYYNQRGHTFELANSLYLRNLDQTQAITIQRLEYRDSDGKLVRRLIDRPLTLPPLASWHMLLPHVGKGEKGTGLVLLDWRARAPAQPPLVQCVVIGAVGQQGISFVLTGRPLATHR